MVWIREPMNNTPISWAPATRASPTSVSRLVNNSRRGEVGGRLSGLVHGQLAISAPGVELGQLWFEAILGAREISELVRCERRAVVIALILITAKSPQELQLFRRFDAFRHHLQSQAVGQRDDGTHDRRIFGSRHDLF